MTTISAASHHRLCEQHFERSCYDFYSTGFWKTVVEKSPSQFQTFANKQINTGITYASVHVKEQR